MARRKFWGWGNEGDGPNEEQARGIARDARRALRRRRRRSRPRRASRTSRCRAPRVSPPRCARRAAARTDPHARASHTYGKSYRDIVRGARGDFAPAPDFVALPRDEADVAALLDWCGERGVAAIPYGGGSSVVGGVEARVGDGYAGAVSIDLGAARARARDRPHLARRAHRGGHLGPALEDALRPHGLTLRHFPQSFEFSTLGGWIATRSGGHYATLYTHIDDFVESLRVVTPAGVVESRRLPGSGAGPSPDRLFIGSEGTLGIITEAWMRLQDRPRFRASRVGALRGRGGFARGAAAVRALAQSGLAPTNCRLLDAGEAQHARARATAPPPCSCSASRAPITRSTRGSRARPSCAATRAALVPEGAVRTRTDDAARARAPRARGATRSSTRPTCATRSCARRSSPRRSRPRSPGTRSRRSTPR